MSTTSNCPCDTCNFPAVISNVPGLSTILYRVGDFTSFRDAMLHALPNEVELANWKPTTTSDLALQMIEWWAYLADILTFYNQRIANQDYLRTADLDASVRNLVTVLGYRPRPGIGATATLAALVSGSQPIALPQGMAVQSKPGPGSAPQVFELLQNTTAQPGGSVSADPDTSNAVFGADGSVLLQGVISSIKTGDLLLLVEKGWSGSNFNYLLANVLSVQPQVSPRGIKNTQVFLSNSPLMLAGANLYTASNYRLLRSTQTARLFQYGVNIDLSLSYNSAVLGTADLDSVTRLIQPGDLVLFDSLNGQTGGALQGTSAPQPPAPPSTPSPSPPLPIIIWESLGVEKQSARLAPQAAKPSAASPAFRSQFKATEGGLGGGLGLGGGEVGSGSGSVSSSEAQVHAGMYLAAVDSYTEVIWYADNPTSPTAPSSPTTGIPVLHSEITFTPSVSAPAANTLVIRYGWQDVGVLVSPPATSFDGTTNLIAFDPPEFPAGEVVALLQDQNGNGDYVSGTVNPATPSELQLAENLPLTAALPLDPTLDPPITVLTNLLPFTRGKTVTNEVLGSGDATQTGQVFTLAKSPLTYLLSAVSISGNNYASTLQVWVNGVQWQEQPSFFGQAASATIFVTREDDNGVTYVQFGDGVNGALLPSGTNNVTASYRYGSGANAPPVGALTVINTPQPGLASMQNPVAAGGGVDPEPSSQMRQNAPLSVLTFGRAISGDDYEAIAASTPGVTRASVVWSFDADAERTVVTVYVGDDQSAQNAAQVALSGDADPNRPVSVVLATSVPLTITLTLLVSPNYDLNAVAALAVTALTDPNTGLFGANNIGIGQAVYRSQIYAACLSVPGAVAVHNLSVQSPTSGTQQVATGNGETTAFSTVKLLSTLIYQGTLQVVVNGSAVGSDNGAGAIVASGSSGLTGTIDYGTGAITLTFVTAPVDGAAIAALYDYLAVSAPGGPNYRFDPGPGGFFTLSPVYTGVPPTGLQVIPEVANG